MSTFVVLATRQALPCRPTLFAALLPTSPKGNQLPDHERHLSWLCSRPSTDIPDARLLPETEASFGRAVPPARSRSVRVVSHHLDGFLRAKSCELVASRCQPWGSMCFTMPDSGRSRGIPQHEQHSSHRRFTPFEEFPSISSRTASLRPFAPLGGCCSTSAEAKATTHHPLTHRPKSTRLGRMARFHRGEAPVRLSRPPRHPSRGPVPMRPSRAFHDRGRITARACSFYPS